MTAPPLPHNLTPVQQNVIAAITGGSTMKAAAQAAGIHRDTITYSRRTSAAFCEALSHAQYDKAILLHEEAESQVADAFAAIHTILTKPDASDSARLNAAKYIFIDKRIQPAAARTRRHLGKLPKSCTVLHKPPPAKPSVPGPKSDVTSPVPAAAT